MLGSLWRDQNHYLELCAILDLSTAGSKEEYLNAYCNEQTSILHKLLVRFPVLWLTKYMALYQLFLISHCLSSLISEIRIIIPVVLVRKEWNNM